MENNATSVPSAILTFDVPSARKLTLVYMACHGAISDATSTVAAPTLLRLQAQTGVTAIPLGEVMDATSVIGVTAQNFGFPFCTDRQAFRGCWELPQGVSTLRLAGLVSEGYGTIFPASPFNCAIYVELIFET